MCDGGPVETHYEPIWHGERGGEMSDREFISGSKLAKAVVWLFFAAVVMQVLSIISQLFAIRSLSEFDGRASWNDLEAHAGDWAVGLIMLVDSLVFLIGAVVFLVWLYRVRVNLPALGIDDVRWSPGWAVVWWFVPIMSLFRPYQVVKETWQASSADARPGKWREVPVPPIFKWWWGMFLVGSIVSWVADRGLGGKHITVENQITGYEILILGELIWGLGALMAIRIVREIDRRQSLPRVTVYEEAFA